MKNLRLAAAVTLITALSCNAETNWPLNSAILGCAATVAVVSYQTVKNYNTLVPLHEKVQSEHALLGDSHNTTMYRWKRDVWPTARTMQHDRENVKRAFGAAFANRELVIHGTANAIVFQPTWFDIKTAIIHEKDELREDLIFLENTFLTIKPILPCMNNRGFVYDYKAACKQAGVDPYANMSWSGAQEQRVETLIKNSYNQKSSFTFGFNYSLAASIYWRLFKLLKRLEVLESLVSELAAGYDAVYVRPQETALTVVVK